MTTTTEDKAGTKAADRQAPSEGAAAARPEPGAAEALLTALVAAQADGEAAVQALIADRLAAAGCTVTRHDYDPAEVPVIGEFAADTSRDPERRSAVLGTLDGDPNLPSLLIFAHPDGEKPAALETWQHDPFQAQLRGGKLHGWGVADDLAGCAAAVLAIESLAASGRPMGRAVFASTPSKRYARGVAALLHDGLRADAALYLHPAESGIGMREIKAVASGHLEFTVTVTGRAPDTTEPGQTAFAHLGVNPIDKAILLRGALMDLAERRAARIRHKLIEARVGRATNLMVSRITAGEMRKFSRLAPDCTLGCALAFPPGESLDQVKAEIAEAIAEAATSDAWLTENPPRIDWLTGVTGAEVPDSHPLYRVGAAAVARVTGAPPEVNPMHTSSDIRNPMVEADIPCIGLGCLGGDLSQNGMTDEWVDLADFQRMVDVTAALAADWCSGGFGPR